MTGHNLVSLSSQTRASFRTCLCRQPWSLLSESPPHTRGALRHFETSSMRRVCRPIRRAWGRPCTPNSDTCSIVASMSPKLLFPDGGGFTESCFFKKKRKAVTGAAMGTILGMCTFVSLCRRDLLSIFSTTYKFVRSCCWSPTPLSSPVRFELCLFRDLMVYLESSWSRQWNSMVMSSDAGMTGWGLAGAVWLHEVVFLVEHTSERSRFRRWEGPNARDHAFRTAFPELVDPYAENLRPPQEDAPDELWIARGA